MLSTEPELKVAYQQNFPVEKMEILFLGKVFILSFAVNVRLVKKS